MAERKVERKSMSDALALDSQKLSFIRSGDKASVEPLAATKEKGIEGAALATKEPMESQEADMDESPSEGRSNQEEKGEPVRSRKPKPRAAPRDFADTLGEPAPVLVPLTTRITQATAESLRRVSLELRLQRRKYAQQDIVEAALRSWLETHGFDR